MTSLSAHGITKSFNKVLALKNVNLRVENGEFCVLLGPSGCGKSTLLNIIAGLIPQDEGSIRFDNEAVDGLSPRNRDVAMVFQNYALYPHMTVAGNLGFGLRMRKLDRPTIRERVREAARLLGIEDLLDRKPRELSGGQRQRVAMGRALVRRPKLFLFDEPLSNLDARLRANVRVELKRMHQQFQGTMIYVTHDQVEAMTLGDRVVVMRDGVVQQEGPPDLIYSRPANAFVARFIGSPEMNLYEGGLILKEAGLQFEGSGFSVDLSDIHLSVKEGDATLGIRPEDVQIGPQGKSEPTGKVELITNLGSEKIVHARLGHETVTIQVPKDTPLGPGSIVSLRFDPARLHVFIDGQRAKGEPPTSQ